MNTSNNPKTFTQKFLAVMQAMEASPADIQWQASEQQAAQIDALNDRVINLERNKSRRFTDECLARTH
jgi:hypothetical protein